MLLLLSPPLRLQLSLHVLILSPYGPLGVALKQGPGSVRRAVSIFIGFFLSAYTQDCFPELRLEGAALHFFFLPDHVPVLLEEHFVLALLGAPVEEPGVDRWDRRDWLYSRAERILGLPVSSRRVKTLMNRRRLISFTLVIFILSANGIVINRNP